MQKSRQKTDLEGGGAMLKMTEKQNEYIVNANYRWNFKVG